MNAGWIVLGIAVVQFLLNVYMTLRGSKLTKANIEKALYNNRQLLGQVLSDVAAQMTAPTPTKLPTAVDTAPIIAHSQAGESK